jgi:hypothetical protein
MTFLFRHHYSLEEARALLPKIRVWLKQLAALREEHELAMQRLKPLLDDGFDVGGEDANRWLRSLACMTSLLAQFHRREIQIKDPVRGLIDFPALHQGREVFLCWEKSEADIGFWHDIDSGYAGREPL